MHTCIQTHIKLPVCYSTYLPVFDYIDMPHAKNKVLIIGIIIMD